MITKKNELKTVKISTFKSSDARRLLAKTAEILTQRGARILGGTAQMVFAGNKRHHGWVKSNPDSFQTLAQDEEIRSAAECAIKSDGHVFNRMIRGDSILGQCQVFIGENQLKLAPSGHLI